MGGASATVPDDWRQLFAGRNVVFAGLPPAPPRVLVIFQNEHARALSHHKTITILVIGA